MIRHGKHLSKLSHISIPVPFFRVLVIAVCACLVGISAILGYLFAFEQTYKNRVYPGIAVGDFDASGKTRDEIESFWKTQSSPFRNAVFTFQADMQIATITGVMLDAGYDASLSATQAFLVGRSGHFFTDLRFKLTREKTVLTPYFRWKNDLLEDMLTSFSQSIDTPAQDALFTFQDNKVTEFKPSIDGKAVNRDKTLGLFLDTLRRLPNSSTSAILIEVPIDPVKPASPTENVNSYGIRELIGRGYSEFSGSIPGRIHNVALATSRFHGVLIAPDEEFSFNKTLGDVSAATGYQPAYIIKAGRTVLGDGGGVCQVSSTLFRAALSAGLPITERHAHAYRVHYYEEGGFKPGMDATVFDPIDLKFKNNTGHHILIQAQIDTDALTMAFEFYGTSDGRSSEIYNQKVWDISPPPAALYQDDPTLPKDVIKQVDWSAWGAKASFDYKVTRNGEIITEQNFFSAYRPWQAVYLRGTKE